MTRISSLAARIIAFSIFALSIAAAQTATAGERLSHIQQKGELVLGTSGNMPPMSQKLDDGQVVGFDIDLARLMASGMGVKLNIKTMSFNEPTAVVCTTSRPSWTMRISK